MTLKELIDTALLECGFPAESAYSTNASPGAKQLVALANRELRSLSKRPWQVLRKTNQFTMTSATKYALPADFRQIINGTFVVTGSSNQVEMPVTDTEWASINSKSMGGCLSARIINNKIEIPAPRSGESLQFDYVSNHPAIDNNGNAKELFTADTDTFSLDEDAMVMGLIWRFKKVKGFDDWQQDRLDADRYIKSLIATDSGADVVRIGGRSKAVLNEPYMDTWA